jgi:glycosyltransferase involved in cell wall biosynthesis
MARISHFYGAAFLRKPIERVTTWAFNRAEYSLAPSRLVQAELLAAGVKRVGLWQRGVDAEKFHPRFRDPEMRHLLSGGHPDQTVLLYAGRLAAEKQIEQLRVLLERIPNTRLALVGDGPNRATLESHFAGLPVTFVGYLTGEPLARAYASADVFVFPSAFESFGLVILEAMASGTPVVSSRVGGAQDMIEEGVSGCTFEVNDVNAMVEAVRRTIATPDVLQRMGQAARQHAEQMAWSHIMDELINCYQAVLDGKQPAS